MNHEPLPAQGPVDVNVRGWISVGAELPAPFDPKLKKLQAYLCYVVDETNLYGGMQMILHYGHFEFYDCEGVFPDSDEDGLVKRFGWHYERDSEGEYDSLTFDMNGKVSHWMPLPEPPNGEVMGASPLAGEASSAEGATSTVVLEGE